MTDLMPATPADAQSLADFARTKSPAALGAIVRRYVDLVYATARRLVGDSHLADDVTQAAFIVLVKKADRLDARTLPGWLVNTTRLAAKEAIRAQHTREKHESRAAEQRAADQRAAFTPAGGSMVSANATDEPTAAELLPLLDDALGQLNAADRTAVVLRFLQGQTFAEVGTATGASEEAARKRVGRAVEKLRAIFMKHSVVPSVGGVMIVLAAQQAKAAPIAAIASATAAIGGSTGVATSVAGAAMIAKNVAATLAWAKLKVAAAVALFVALAGGAVVGTVAIHLAMQAPPGTPVAMTNASTTKPTAAPFSAILRSGVTVRLIGASELPTPSTTWWQPDGSPLAAAPHHWQMDRALDRKVWRPVDMVLQVGGPPGSIEPNVTCDSQGADFAYNWSANSWPGDWRKPRTSDVAFPPTQETTVFRVHVAAGQWQTSGSSLRDTTDPTAAVYFKPPMDEKSGASVSVLMNYAETSVYRIVAIDDADEVHEPVITDATPGYDETAKRGQLKQLFRGLSLKNVKEFQLQTRPYDQWVEFQNVSLKPGVKTDVKILTSNDVADSLQGAWDLVSGAKRGVAVPKEELATFGQWVIAGDKLSSTGSNVESSLKLNSQVTPAQIDIIPPAGKRDADYAIYSVNGDTLQLCLGPNEGGRPTQFVCTPGSNTSLLVFHRHAGPPTITAADVKKTDMQERKERIACANKMRQIWEAMVLFGKSNQGNYPDDLAQVLVSEPVKIDAFICPSIGIQVPAEIEQLQKEKQVDWLNANSGYVYLGRGKKFDLPPDYIVLYEKATPHGNVGINMMFGDGHCEFVPFQGAKESLAAQGVSFDLPAK